MVAPGRQQFLQRESSSRSVREDSKLPILPLQETSYRATTKSFRFADQVIIHTTIHRSDYSAHEIEQAFWSRKDMRRIKVGVKEAVLQLEEDGGCRQEDIDPSELIVTERFMYKTTYNRKLKRKQAARTVIYQQKLDGKLDEFWLLRRYRPLFTNASIHSAYIRALACQVPHRASAPFSHIMVR